MVEEEPPSLPLMGIEDFVTWLQEETELGIEHPWSPESDVRADLGLDDLEIFGIANRLRELVRGEASVGSEIFQHTESVRDLYLYYMMISSMPKE